MIKTYKTIRTYIFWFIVTSFYLPLCLLISYLPENKRHKKLYFFFTNQWNSLLVFFAFLVVKIKKEKEDLPDFYKHPAIFVMNHASALDIPLAEYVVGKHPHIWISKQSYAKIPLFGKLLQRMHALINKENPKQSTQALIRAYKLAQKYNLSVLLFPEGTRSTDGKLGEFLGGFYLLAKKLNRPVIPVAILGANEIMKKNSLLLDPRASDIKITIGTPIFVKENETEEEFSNKIRSWFNKHIQK
ncbi:TPA: hypothetical protein DEO28_02850 [Candidatus Dependentiae bacterium]|nr:MAG: 1-acylglycerol-3-phosphate O-acyltransferase [candidate division TM6 bacterium GW2011_GWE2_31_21]KKP53155.1 MAG: 1-acylglycerol-3-phosphate O-acyltransferase [candidate division TM6 bacterium GW2011_GWF2_33_332]HBS47974.1 hypothetical protein [Candidatus Dependentiae bacterium]HBZ73422.1 hypothetical protein [Candidatus Dependentiae bacterium]